MTVQRVMSSTEERRGGQEKVEGPQETPAAHKPAVLESNSFG